MASRNNMDDKPDPNDILIAVMGATGAGKSTLISHCTDEYVPIGSDLQSHTSAVASYPVATQSGQKIYLVDTPGFDDTNLDDADVLKLIASWLNKRYEQDILLRGILYLHKISDNRMTGTARKNLRLMKKICGKDALKNIILTTTMWEKVEPAEGHDRERQLVKTPEYWGDMIQNHGSRVERCFNTKESAMEVVESLLSSGDEALAIQKEMANGAKKLNETTAGMTLNEELEKEREKFSLQLEELRREFETSRKEWDEDAMMQIQQEREDKQREIDEIRRQQEKMKVENDEMNKQMQEQALAHCAAVVQLQAQQEQMVHGSRMDQNYQWRLIDPYYLYYRAPPSIGTPPTQGMPCNDPWCRQCGPCNDPRCRQCGQGRAPPSIGTPPTQGMPCNDPRCQQCGQGPAYPVLGM